MAFVRRHVAEQLQGTVVVCYDHVDVSVVVDVAHGRAPADVGPEEGWPGLVAHLTEATSRASLWNS